MSPYYPYSHRTERSLTSPLLSQSDGAVSSPRDGPNSRTDETDLHDEIANHRNWIQSTALYVDEPGLV